MKRVLEQLSYLWSRFRSVAIAIVLPFYNEEVISPNCAERPGFLELIVFGLTPVRHQKDSQNALVWSV